jgi:RNA polymerase-binding transcription factor DksA
MSEQGLTLTAKQLQDLVAAAVAAAVTEAKKPVITEAQQREIEAAQESRAQSAAQVIKMAEDKRAAQAACGHMRRDGSTYVTYIQNGDYLICQKCQDVIRRADRPEMFNRLFQLTQNNGMFA